MKPEEVLALADQLMRDGNQLDALAQTIPGKIQRIEDAARQLRAAVVTPDNLNQTMRALQQIHEGLQAQQQYLKQVAEKMNELINF